MSSSPAPGDETPPAPEPPEADSDAPPPSADTAAAGPADEPPPSEAGVISRPLPGMRYSPIVGSGGWGAFFEDDSYEHQARLEGAPGELLLAVEPRGIGLRGCLLTATAFVCATSPLSAFAADLDQLYPQAERARFWWTLVGVCLAGLALGLYSIGSLSYAGTRVLFTSEGIALEGGVSASWVPWGELQGYELEQGSCVLATAEGRLGFLLDPAQEEAARALFEERRIPAGLAPLSA